METPQRKKIFYGWMIALCCFLMTFVGLGLGNSPKGQYIVPVTADLEMSRSLFTFTFSIREIVKSAANLFFGVLAVKFGPRKLASAGFASLAVCFLLFSVSSALPTFYLGGVLMGIGVTFTSTATVSALVSNWFVDHRGTIMGVIFAGSGLGGTLFSLLTQGWIFGYGWRRAYLLTAAVMAVMVLPMALFLRNRPEEKGLAALGAGGTAQVRKRKTIAWKGLPFRTLWTRPYFYAGCAAAFFFGALTNPVMTTVVAQLENNGLTGESAAVVYSALQLAMAAAKILCGMMYDRWGLNISVTVCLLADAIGCCLLAVANSLPLAVAFALIFAFCLPLETIMIPLVAADLYGQQSSTQCVGVFLALMSAGIAVGTPVIQAFYDVTASYAGILLLFGGISVGVLLVLLAAGRRAGQLRREEQEREA